MKLFLFNPSLLLLLILVLSACQADEFKASSVTPSLTRSTISEQNSLTPTPVQQASTATMTTPSKTQALPVYTLTPDSPRVTTTTSLKKCSPLAGISLSELGTVLSNPFSAGRVGFDEGHPGIDFSYWSRGERKSMQGHLIQSIFSGVVVATIVNKPPYGNSVIIETHLRSLPEDVQENLSGVKAIPAVIPDARLYCPGFQLSASNPPVRDALYVMYGHLDQPTHLQIGEEVSCGEQIGLVGTTGFSVNYHLHLEVRFAPTGYRFREMAHYDNSATTAEMRAYCTWRASGLFQALDPAVLFGFSP